MFSSVSSVLRLRRMVALSAGAFCIFAGVCAALAGQVAVAAPVAADAARS